MAERFRLRGLWLSLLLLPAATWAQDHTHHAGHRMTVDAAGMTMNANHDTLPEDCSRLNREHRFEVHAGSPYAESFPGSMFGFDIRELRVEPCSRVTVTLVNEDEVRHQWMVHGLPRYLYPGGMFHLEAAGGKSRTASFIVPSDERTYLVHCDLTQHMEKGMKAQLKVGRGSGNLWSVPGVTGDLYTAGPGPARLVVTAGIIFLVALLLGVLGRRAIDRRGR